MIQNGSVINFEVAKRPDHDCSQHKQMKILGREEGGGLANTNIVRNKFKSTHCIQTYTVSCPLYLSKNKFKKIKQKMWLHLYEISGNTNGIRND